MGSRAGSGWSTAEVVIPSSWNVNHETAISYRIDAGLGLSNFTVKIGVDNGVYAWLDGVYEFGAMAPLGAFGYPNWEYIINIGSVSGGVHFLQFLREDHGGGTGWTIEATGDPISAVPEPTTMLLLGTGLAGLAGLRRRFKK